MRAMDPEVVGSVFRDQVALVYPTRRVIRGVVMAGGAKTILGRPSTDRFSAAMGAMDPKVVPTVAGAQIPPRSTPRRVIRGVGATGGPKVHFGSTFDRPFLSRHGCDGPQNSRNGVPQPSRTDQNLHGVKICNFVDRSKSHGVEIGQVLLGL